VKNTLEQAADSGRKTGAIKPGESILLAVSGGPDSVFLLQVLASLAAEMILSLQVAYIHHHLRKAADRENAFVKNLAARHGLPFHVRHIRLRSKKSLEDAARRKRYEVLKRLAEKTGCAAIATGHTLDDQAETVLMHLLRGAGAGGLAGMAPRVKLFRDSKIEIVRPLLGVSKAEIEEFLGQQRIKYRVDRSNLGRRFTRNRVRRELIPILEQFNPGIKKHLAKTALLLRDDFDCLNREAEELFRLLCRRAGGGYRLTASAFPPLPKAHKRLLISRLISRLTGSPYRSFRVIEEIREGIEAGKKRFLVSGVNVRVVRENATILFRLIP